MKQVQDIFDRLHSLLHHHSFDQRILSPEKWRPLCHIDTAPEFCCQ